MQRRYAKPDELGAYTTELKQLLASGDLTPDTRARALTALVDALALNQAADKVHSAAQTTLADTLPVLRAVVESFGEHARFLASALQRLPDR